MGEQNMKDLNKKNQQADLNNKAQGAELNKNDQFAELRKLTKARIGLENAGTSLATKHQLEMMSAHARAKDAITYPLNFSLLANQLTTEFPNLNIFSLRSQVKNRHEYLRRPDLGRLLSADSKKSIEAKAFQQNKINFIIVDGLSGLAIENYALNLILATAQYFDSSQIGDISLVENGRVAIGDQIGEIFQSQLTVILIGERPGLTSYDSVGAYLTYRPGSNKSDADRNCISNICASGLPVTEAAHKLAAMIKASIQLQISGTSLKEDQALLAFKK